MFFSVPPVFPGSLSAMVSPYAGLPPAGEPYFLPPQRRVTPLMPPRAPAVTRGWRRCNREMSHSFFAAALQRSKKDRRVFLHQPASGSVSEIGRVSPCPLVCRKKNPPQFFYFPFRRSQTPWFSLIFFYSKCFLFGPETRNVNSD